MMNAAQRRRARLVTLWGARAFMLAGAIILCFTVGWRAMVGVYAFIVGNNMAQHLQRVTARDRGEFW